MTTDAGAAPMYWAILINFPCTDPLVPVTRRRFNYEDVNLGDNSLWRSARANFPIEAVSVLRRRNFQDREVKSKGAMAPPDAPIWNGGEI